MEMSDVLNELGIPYKEVGEHHHARPGYLQLDCPYCSPNWNHFRLGYNIRARYCICWACGRHGVIESLMEITGRPYREIARLVKEVPEGDRVEKIPRGKLKLPDGVGPLQDAHKAYLRKRKFKWRELQRLWEIKGIGLSADLPWRIFIPIFLNGTMVSWTTRSIDDVHSGRYISAGPEQESIDHKSILYGEDYCRHSIVLCEGPTDVWALGPGSTCSFGTGFSASQVDRIAKYPVRVVCFDNERFAQDRANELCRSLEVFSGETYNVRLSGKDAASTMETNPEEIVELRKRFLGDYE